MSRKIVIYTLIIIICFLLINMTVFASSDVQIYENNVEIPYILLELEKGQVLSQQNTDLKIDAAMLSQMMTCLISLETLSPTLEITPKAGLTSIGNNFTLNSSQTYTVDSLVKAAMIGDSKNASNALANYINSDMGYFVSVMNNKAQEFKMSNTYFTNPSGVNDAAQYTTVTDISMFLRNALRNPSFKNIYEAKYGLIWNNSVVMHPNKFIYDNTFFVVGASLSKNVNSSSCIFSVLISSERDIKDDTLIMMLVMSNVSENSYQEFGSKVLRNALDKYNKNILVRKGDVIQTVKVENDDLKLVASTDIYYIFPKDDDNFIENKSYSWVSEYSSGKISPPVHMGSTFGVAHYLLKDGTTIDVSMVASDDVLSSSSFVEFFTKKLTENRGILITVIFLLFLEAILIIAKLYNFIVDRIKGYKSKSVWVKLNGTNKAW